MREQTAGKHWNEPPANRRFAIGSYFWHRTGRTAGERRVRRQFVPRFASGSLAQRTSAEPRPVRVWFSGAANRSRTGQGSLGVRRFLEPLSNRNGSPVVRLRFARSPNRKRTHARSAVRLTSEPITVPCASAKVRRHHYACMLQTPDACFDSPP